MPVLVSSPCVKRDESFSISIALKFLLLVLETSPHIVLRLIALDLITEEVICIILDLL